MSKYIRDYKIIRILGKGNYASAYLVSKSTYGINQNYVIKQIPLEDLSPSEKEEVKKEAELLSKINSDFVVKYFDSFEENNFLNIVMEYCEGGDLEQLIKERYKIPLNDNFIWKLFIQIVIGLAELHNKKILHRDLKTSNIFLTKNYDIKIGDLGVAKMLSKNDFAKTVIGTPYYLSPEICKEKPYNEKSDIWALGCVLYELCTFNHPFESTNQAALINKILKENPKPIPYTFDYYFNEIVKKLLQKNMDKRPSCKLILKGQYVIKKAKELKLYHKYQKLIEHNKSLSRNNSKKNKLKLALDDNSKIKEKTNYFTLNTIDNNLSIKTRPKSCSKCKKIENPNLIETKKTKHKKHGIPFAKKNPFINDKYNRMNLKQMNQEIIKSITNRKKNKNILMRRSRAKSINKRDNDKNKNNLYLVLLDTLEMNKNRFNDSGINTENDSSIYNKENYDINQQNNIISSNQIIANGERIKAHQSIYNNQYDSPKVSSPLEEKYSLKELIDDFQSPKSPFIINNLNNNLSKKSDQSSEKNVENDKKSGNKLSAFHIHYNKNNQNSEKDDNYLSESEEEKYSIQKEIKKSDDKSDNEDGVEEERVRIINDEGETCPKRKENIKDVEDIKLLIEKTKRDLFEIIGEKNYRNITKNISINKNINGN